MKLFISKLFLLFLFLSVYSFSTAQIINSYARITAVAGATITISLAGGDVNQAAGAFANGQRVIVMQMQDDVIGNTADALGFGNIGNIRSAGLYEITTIASRTGPTVVLSSLVNTFNIGANSRLQLISFPENCNPIGGIVGLPWNGNIGGVIALRCPGTMTLGGSINADGIGFGGGAVSGNFENGCVSTIYRTANNNYGSKGESIHLRTVPNQERGSEKLANGGGGGISHNGGGGGGGNMTAGGKGGIGYLIGGFEGCDPGVGGFGGVALFPYVNLNRVFMGGGGGGSNQNNGLGTSGANGGGIVIIEAVQLTTAGVCNTAIQITANGNNSANSGGNDSAGGAGAGGSIIFRVNIIIINPDCPLTNEARGGAGGRANITATHGGGAGGGRGLILFAVGCNTTIPNLTADANVGAGGCNNDSNPCNSSADGGSTAGSNGIICDELLPIEWLSLDAEYKDNQSIIDWKTTIDKELSHFEIERSSNGKDWKKIGQVMAYQTSASSASTLDYQFIDKEWIAQLIYYRIKQVDNNGSSKYSPVVSVNPKRTGELTIYPNPAKDKLYISYLSQNKPIQTKIISSIGKVISVSKLENNNEIELNITNLSAGIYLLSIQLENGEIINHKFVVEK